jgi:4-hydroxy-tetrahydrodipicolinate synthase
MNTSSLAGIIPPMTTPFNRDGSIDLGAFKAQIRFMEEAGVYGVCVGGSTGEGHTLEAEELRTLWSAAARELSGRIPLVAGVIVNSTRQAVERCRLARDCGAVALQVTPPHYIFKPDEDAVVEHFRAIAEQSETPVLIYNVVPWCYLSPALLLRILREVPGVIGVKQSNGDLKLLADLLLDLPQGKRVFAATDALLYSSFALGAHGAIAALPAAVPRACLALWNAVQRGDHATAQDIHGKLLRLWNAIAGDALPANAKFVQSLQGVPMGWPRAPMRVPDTAQQAALRAAFEALS